jgi:alpha-L-fucosidase
MYLTSRYICLPILAIIPSVIGDLVDIVSENGVLLLNVGLRPDGTIPEPEEKMLLEIG